ncbi:MAG TPA: protein-L-isoaspartate O-methyltransferase, partial [Gammaproteobacteria bacterium]|nr:protein-L-isoaspartate O-methyltransferase [Gammaproteobacteria bacterium]
METFNIDTARNNMIEQQIRPWDVLDMRVLDVLRDTPREAFVPEDKLDLAFMDIEIPIGHGETMLTPRVEGRLLQSLDLQPSDSVLEIGTGTGYLTACLARLAGAAFSVDIHEDFTQRAKS